MHVKNVATVIDLHDTAPYAKVVADYEPTSWRVSVPVHKNTVAQVFVPQCNIVLATRVNQQQHIQNQKNRRMRLRSRMLLKTPP